MRFEEISEGLWDYAKGFVKGGPTGRHQAGKNASAAATQQAQNQGTINKMWQGWMQYASSVGIDPNAPTDGQAVIDFLSKKWYRVTDLQLNPADVGTPPTPDSIVAFFQQVAQQRAAGTLQSKSEGQVAWDYTTSELTMPDGVKATRNNDGSWVMPTGATLPATHPTAMALEAMVKKKLGY